MVRDRWGVIVVALLVVGIAGCGDRHERQLPGVPPADRELKQAADALARWDAAVKRAGNLDFVPVGELTGQVGDWEEAVGGNNKLALSAGALEAATPLPTSNPGDGEVRWQNGTVKKLPTISAAQALDEMKAQNAGPCPECVPLRVVAARLSTAPVQTSRGPATAPAWEFTLEGTKVKATRIAVASRERVTVVPPPWDSYNSPAGMSVESATGTVAGRKLMVSFTGAPHPADRPCGVDYTARAVESATAVVVILTARPHGANETCNAMGATRTATVELAQPLGERAVLEVREGLPVPVTLTA